MTYDYIEEATSIALDYIDAFLEGSSDNFDIKVTNFGLEYLFATSLFLFSSSSRYHSFLTRRPFTFRTITCKICF